MKYRNGKEQETMKIEENKREKEKIFTKFKKSERKTKENKVK